MKAARPSVLQSLSVLINSLRLAIYQGGGNGEETDFDGERPFNTNY